MHVGGAYYGTPASQYVMYDTSNFLGTHALSWATSEFLQANLVEAHAFPRDRVTYTDMIPTSVFAVPPKDREVFKRVGTDNTSGDVNWAQVDEWLHRNKSDFTRGGAARALSRAGACFDAMVGENALIVLDSDGSPEHHECLHFMTCDIWKSALFNPQSLVPPSFDTWPWTDSHPFRRPGIRRVLLDVMYKGDTEDGERVPNFRPNDHVLGNGSVKAIIVLYSIPRCLA